MFKLPYDFQWQLPWSEISEESREMAEAELKRELPQNHVLAGCQFVAVGESMNYDDYLFVTDCKDKPLAAVHLTWSIEIDPMWPSTATYPTLEAWTKAMSDEHAEFQRRTELGPEQTSDDD